MTTLTNPFSTPPAATLPVGNPTDPSSRDRKIAREFDLQKAISNNRLIGLWRLATGYRHLYIGAFVAVTIAAVAKMTTYLLVQYLVDEIIGKEAGTAVIFALLAGGFIGLAVIEGTLTFIGQSLAVRTAEKTIQRLRNYVFDHLQRMTFTYHDVNKTGDLIQRASSDMDAVRRFYADQAIAVGRILLPFVINVVALFILNAQLAAYSVIVIPFVFAASMFFGNKIEKSYEHFQEQDGVISSTLQENLAGVRVVKAFARQDYEIDKFRKDNYEKYLRGRKLIRWHAVYWPTADILTWTQMLVGFFLAGTLAINKQISPGTYLAYVGILVQIIWPLRNLGRVLVETTTAMVSYNRIAEVMRNKREDLNEANVHLTKDLRGEVEFNDVTFVYAQNQLGNSSEGEGKSKAEGKPKNDTGDKPKTKSEGETEDKPVLQNITFTARPGEVIALLGSTGSGKTSLVNLLPRFYEYTSGSIKLDGIELKDYSRDYLRNQIGGVEQEPFLFSRTIRENITYGVQGEVSDEAVIAAAQAAAVHDAIMSFPQGYSTLVGEKGVSLSGGQKQRVALARILLKNPRILILDDATSSVDTETEGQIRDALRTLMTDRTTFLIAHRIQSVMIADQILVLDQGKIVQRGTHDELMAEDGFYRQIYALQSQIESELEEEIASVGL